jgi:hypothetical protein
LDAVLLSSSSPPRIDEQHPEYKKVQCMTEEEELDYINQTYFPQNEDWGITDQLETKSTTTDDSTGTNQK